MISRGSCQIQPKNAAPEMISSELIDCDFESDFCNWKHNLIGTQFEWSLKLDGDSFLLMINS